MLATEKPRHPTPAETAAATGQRGTLEAQAKNPASDQGQVNIGTGAARRLAGDYDRTRMPLPAAPAASAAESLSGYTPTGRAGVYRNGNAFSDQNGISGAFQMDRGPAGAPALSASEQLVGLPRTAAPAAPATPATPSAGPNADALARLQANNAAAQPAPAAAPRQFDRAASIRALSDLRSPEAIALRNLRIDAQEEARDSARMGRAGRGNNAAGQAYAALVGELTTGTRQGQTAEMQDAGATQRTGMQEAGATGRTAMTEGGNMARARMTNDIQMGELGLKRETAAISNSAAQQLAQVRQSYVNARTPQERAQAAQTLRVLTGKDEQPTAPTGYRWAGGGNLQAIPGGPGDKTQQGKPMPTAAASGLLGNRENLRRAENALSLLNGEQQPGGVAGDPNATGFKGYLPNQVLNRVDPKGVDTRAAIADLGSLIIHDRSGAAVTAAEFPRLAPFLATEKDDPATARKKLDQFVKNYKANIDDTTEFYRQLGYAVPNYEPTAQQGGQPQPAQIPQAGEVRKGFRFKGGNPADRNAWEAVQ